jgi:hypothetical protein
MTIAQTTKIGSVLFFGVMLSIFLMGWTIQSHFLLNHDVAWLLEASKRFLNGGSYSSDFFENNPPMIIYLYIPPVIVSKIFSMNLIVTFRAYVFLLAFLSLYFCHIFNKKIFVCEIGNTSQDTLTRSLFEMGLAITFLVTPLFEFGQREHLMLILTMPYFLAIACRLQGHTLTRSQAISIGIMGGLGFALKPYFLFPFIFIESYYLYRNKNWRAWQRPECLVVLSLFILYPIMVFIFNRDYYSVIVPYAWHWCYLGARFSWQSILIKAPILFCVMMILFYLMQSKTNAYKPLMPVLLVALVGFLTSYMIQHLYYPYHVLPAYSVALLIAIILFAQQLFQPVPHKILWFTALIETIAGISFFNDLPFLNLFLLTSQPWIYLKYIAVFFAISFFLIFALKIHQNKQQTLSIATLGMLLFAFPSIYFYTNYICSPNRISIRQKEPELIHFIDTHALHKSIYFFTTQSNVILPFYYEDTRYVSRFSFFWMLGALVSQPYFNPTVDLKQNTQDMDLLINMVSDDLNKKKPDFVLVDTSPVKRYLFYRNQTQGMPISFEYLPLFSKNNNFNQAWKHYAYLQNITVDSHVIYAIYQRKE